jgi:hypothetical protein
MRKLLPYLLGICVTFSLCAERSESLCSDCKAMLKGQVAYYDDEGVMMDPGGVMPEKLNNPSQTPTEEPSPSGTRQGPPSQFANSTEHAIYMHNQLTVRERHRYLKQFSVPDRKEIIKAYEDQYGMSPFKKGTNPR